MEFNTWIMRPLLIGVIILLFAFFIGCIDTSNSNPSYIVPNVDPNTAIIGNDGSIMSVSLDRIEIESDGVEGNIGGKYIHFYFTAKNIGQKPMRLEGITTIDDKYGAVQDSYVAFPTLYPSESGSGYTVFVVSNKQYNIMLENVKLHIVFFRAYYPVAYLGPSPNAEKSYVDWYIDFNTRSVIKVVY